MPRRSMTAVNKASVKGGYKTTIPAAIVNAMRITYGDTLLWTIVEEKGEMVAKFKKATIS